MKYTREPNVVAEWLTFLLYIWEVPDSSLSSESGYPEVFMVFLSFSTKMLR
jgi:hypothetical protein